MTRPKRPRRVGVLFLRNFPVDLKNAYKTWCFLHGISMTQDVKLHMIERVKGLNPQAAKKAKKEL